MSEGNFMEEAGQPGTSTGRRSRRQLAAIAIAIAVVGVVGTGSALYYLSQAPPACRTPGPGEPIKIGFTIARDGRYNIEGTAALNGINTAVQWVNDQGGVAVQGTARNLTLVFYNDESDATNIVPLYSRLVQQDGAHFLIAPYSSALTAAAAPIGDQYNCIMLSHGGASDLIFAERYRNLVGVLSPASSYLRTAVDWLKANSPDDQIAALYEGDQFSRIAGESAVEYARSLGLEVVYDAFYPTGVTDLTAQLAAAKNAGADALIGGGHYADGYLVMSQLTSAGWTPNFISLLVAVTEPKFNEELGDRANNVTGPSQWEAAVRYGPDTTPTGFEWYGPTPTEFADLYRNRFAGQSPSYHAAEAAAAILVLAKAINEAESLGTNAVRGALGDMKLVTFFGEYEVDETGLQLAHDMVQIQWQDGQLKVVAPAEVAEVPLRYPYTGS
jgi:branched-chain amino acid transport system substrate-binding protein